MGNDQSQQLPRPVAGTTASPSPPTQRIAPTNDRDDDEFTISSSSSSKLILQPLPSSKSCTPPVSHQRYVRSANSTPRVGTPPSLRSVQKSSDSSLLFDANRRKQHRLSADIDIERRVGHQFDRRGKLSVGDQQAQRITAAIKTGDYGLSLCEQLKLTNYQAQLLGSTWSKLRTAQASFAQMFKSLTQSNNSAREIFQKMSIVDGFSTATSSHPHKTICDIREHVRLLIDLLDSCIPDVHTQPSIALRQRCGDIGRSHCILHSRGMTPIMWDEMCDAMAISITRAECVRAKRDAVKAWIALISYIFDSIKTAYIVEVKKRNQLQKSLSSKQITSTINYCGRRPSSPVQSPPPLDDMIN